MPLQTGRQSCQPHEDAVTGVQAASLAQLTQHRVKKLAKSATLDALTAGPNIDKDGSLSTMQQWVTSLAGKVRSQNSTLSDVDRQSLAIIRVYLQRVVDHSLVQHNADQKEIDQSRNYIQGCSDDTLPIIDGFKGAMEQKRDAHGTCRAKEARQTSIKEAACIDYDVYRKSMPSMPDCLASKLTAQKIATNDPVAKQDMEACLQKTHSWVASVYNKYTLCMDNTLVLTNLTKECDTKQAEYEKAFCMYEEKYAVACPTQDSCRARSIKARNTSHAEVHVSESVRKATVESGKRILCLLDAIIANSTSQANSALGSCRNQSFNASVFDITYHGIPSAIECEVVANKPCEPSWLHSEYESKVWYSNSTLNTSSCQSCAVPQAPETTTSAPTALLEISAAQVAKLPSQRFGWRCGSEADVNNRHLNVESIEKCNQLCAQSSTCVGSSYCGGPRCAKGYRHTQQCILATTAENCEDRTLFKDWVWTPAVAIPPATNWIPGQRIVLKPEQAFDRLILLQQRRPADIPGLQSGADGHFRYWASMPPSPCSIKDKEAGGMSNGNSCFFHDSLLPSTRKNRSGSPPLDVDQDSTLEFSELRVDGSPLLWTRMPDPPWEVAFQVLVEPEDTFSGIFIYRTFESGSALVLSSGLDRPLRFQSALGTEALTQDLSTSAEVPFGGGQQNTGWMWHRLRLTTDGTLDLAYKLPVIY